MKDSPVEGAERTERAGYHHGSLPAALTEAALELLDERGPEQVSVREVARRAGVSPGAPFRHFADRQALLTAVAGRILADFEQWQSAAVEGAEGPLAMRAFGLGFVRYTIRHPHRFELIRSRVFGAEQPTELHQRLSGIEQALTGIIVAGQQAGELRAGDPAVVGLAGQALVYGLSQMIVDGYLPADRAEQLAEHVLDTFGLGVVAFTEPSGPAHPAHPAHLARPADSGHPQSPQSFLSLLGLLSPLRLLVQSIPPVHPIPPHRRHRVSLDPQSPLRCNQRLHRAG